MAISLSSVSSSVNSSSRVSFRNCRSAFTLIEMVVALSIIAVIAAVTVTYSNEASRSLLLLNTQTRILAILSHAKSLSQNFSLSAPAGRQICSYGVHVDRATGRFMVFRDMMSSTSDCNDSNNIHSSGEEMAGEVNNFNIDLKNLRFVASANSASPDIVDVVFVPPHIEAIINDDTSANSGSIIIEVVNTSPAVRFEIVVNKFAQITVK